MGLAAELEQHETDAACRAFKALWSSLPKPTKDSNKKKTIRIRCRVRFRVILILRPHKLAIKKKVTKTKKHRMSLGVVLG